MTMLFELREHKHDPTYNPDIRFLKPTATVLRLDSYAAGYDSFGTGYNFHNYIRSWLNGKRIKIYWRGFYDGQNRTFAILEILDGNYSRSSMTDFPNGSDRILKGNGVLSTLRTKTNTWAWETWTSGVLDLSGGTQSDCCLFVRLYDSWTLGRVWIEVDYIQILDAAGTIVLAEEHYTDSVHMEVSGTYNDYGYISSGMEILEKNVTETFSLIETALVIIHIYVTKSVSETFTLIEQTSLVNLSQYAPPDLIDRAIAYAREAYEDFKTDLSFKHFNPTAFNPNAFRTMSPSGKGITEGLTPKAYYGITHLRLRNDLNRGCREASKLIPINYKRSIGFSVLMMALNDIFKYHNPTLTKQIYNETLRRYNIIPPP